MKHIINLTINEHDDIIYVLHDDVEITTICYTKKISSFTKTQQSIINSLKNIQTYSGKFIELRIHENVITIDTFPWEKNEIVITDLDSDSTEMNIINNIRSILC
jgi:hypothetical protein